MRLHLWPLHDSCVSHDVSLDDDEEGNTMVFRVYVSVPWDSGIDEWTRSFLVEEDGKVDSYFGTPSGPDIRSESARSRRGSI